MESNVSSGTGTQNSSDLAAKNDREQIEQFRAVQGDLIARLETLGAEVDAIQVEMSRPRRWYTDASVIIAVMALTFSLLTTGFAYYQSSLQQINEFKTELRDIITRISQIPRDYTEYTKTYATDPATLGLFNASLQAENAMLAKRAMEIAGKIPQEVTSSEYLLIGQSLFNSNITEETMTMYDMAIRRAANSNDLVGGLRLKANLQMLLGDIQGGRNSYQSALDVFRRYPSTNQFYVDSTNATTEIAWAISEFTIGACENVKPHLDAAETMVNQLRPESSADFFRKQLETYKKNTQGCDGN